jgi:hypothetical protein
LVGANLTPIAGVDRVDAKAAAFKDFLPQTVDY